MSEPSWNGFISYSHARDRQVGVELRNALHAFARPMFGLRRVRIFLDVASLPPGDLPGTLRATLDRSSHLIVLCSPEAAASRWVEQEVSHWLMPRSARDIILVRTAGNISWAGMDFDWGITNAVPLCLKGRFASQPLWLDLAFARGVEGVRRRPEFQSVVAAIASVLLDRPLDELAGEDVRTQRRLRKLRNAALGGLAILTAISLMLAALSERNRRSAVGARDRALERALAISALNASEGSPDLTALQQAAAYAVEAQRRTPSSEAWMAATRAISKLPAAILISETAVTAAHFRPTSGEFAVATTDGRVTLHRRDGTELWSRRLGTGLSVAAWSPSGDTLFAAGPSGSIVALSADGKVGYRQKLGFAPERIQWKHARSTESAASEMWALNDNEVVVVGADRITLLDLPTGNRTELMLDAGLTRATRCAGTLAWAETDGRVRSIGIRLGTSPTEVHTHVGLVESLACADGGRSIASAGSDDTVQWMRNGRHRSICSAGWSQVNLSGSGDHLSVQQLEQGGKSFDHQDGENRLDVYAFDVIDPILERHHSNQSELTVFRGNRLFAASEPHRVIDFDTGHDGNTNYYLLGSQIERLDLDPEGRTLVTAGSQRGVAAIDLAQGQRRPLAHLPGTALWLEVSADARSALVIANVDDQPEGHRRAVVISDLVDGGGPIELKAASGFERQGDHFLSVFAGASSKVVSTHLDPYGSKLVADVGGSFSAIAVDPSSGAIQLAGDSGVVMLDPRGRELWRDPAGLIQGDKPFFSANGEFAVLATPNLDSYLRRTVDGQQMNLRRPHEGPNVWAYSPDVAILAESVRFGTMALIDQASGRTLTEFDHNDAYSTVYAANGSWFAAVTSSNHLAVFSLVGPLRRLESTLPIHANRNLEAAPDGGGLYVLGENGLSRVDLAAGLVNPKVLVTNVQAEGVWPSPDGVRIAAAFADRTGRLIDIRSGQTLLAKRFSANLKYAAFGPSDCLALVSADGVVRIFDIGRTRLLAEIHPDLGVIRRVTFVRAGRWIAIDGTAGVTLYRTDPFLELSRRAGANLSEAAWSAVGGEGEPPISYPTWEMRA